MANEVLFSLPKDTPQEQKDQVKQMFQLIDEVAQMKQQGDTSPEYETKRNQLEALRTTLRPLLHQADLKKNLGVKIGIRNIQRNGNTLSVDVRPVSYPVYSIASDPTDKKENLDLGAVTGTAAVLVTKDNKLILQHRSPKNSPYGDMPGASFAGMVDAKMKRVVEEGNLKEVGIIEPIDTNYIKKSAAEERKQEIGLDESDITQFSIVGEARDHVREHDEFLLLAKTRLTAQEVAQKAAKAPRSEKKKGPSGDFHFEESFITLDATPEAIETLLTEVKCPLPPTHTAAFVAAGYHLIIESKGLTAANEWKKHLESKVKQNFEAMNAQVQAFYKANPEKLNDNKPGKPKRNPHGYEPYYTPVEQGLPSLQSELERTGLVTREQKRSWLDRISLK